MATMSGVNEHIADECVKCHGIASYSLHLPFFAQPHKLEPQGVQMEASSPADAAADAPTPQVPLGIIGQEAAPSSCLSASSADKAWGLGFTASSTTPSTASGNSSTLTGQGITSFKESMKDAMREVCRQHGGPRAYLNKTSDTAEKRKMFATTLLREFPMRDTQEYVTSLNIPAISKYELGKRTPSVFHMASFSFS